MQLVAWIVICGIVGLLAAAVMSGPPPRGIARDAPVGMLGAMIGGPVFSPLVGAATIVQDDFGIASLFISFFGAVLLLAAVRLIRRRRVR